jgi:hypothetical protein
MRLFSYTIPWDYGSAPNPFWGLCTLTICKPVIRRVAVKNDWVVGLQGVAVVYAMEVTDRRSLQEYDAFCRDELPQKIPKWSSPDLRRRVGDCIYDYSQGYRPRLRRGIHTEAMRANDLGGLNALLSENFYYFGQHAIPLPTWLHPIVQKRGHKSDANEPYKARFVRWIRRQRHAHNKIVAKPALIHRLVSPQCASECSERDCIDARMDECLVRCQKC